MIKVWFWATLNPKGVCDSGFGMGVQGKEVTGVGCRAYRKL